MKHFEGLLLTALHHGLARTGQGVAVLKELKRKNCILVKLKIKVMQEIPEAFSRERKSGPEGNIHF